MGRVKRFLTEWWLELLIGAVFIFAVSAILLTDEPRYNEIRVEFHLSIKDK